MEELVDHVGVLLVVVVVDDDDNGVTPGCLASSVSEVGPTGEVAPSSALSPF